MLDRQLIGEKVGALIDDLGELTTEETKELVVDVVAVLVSLRVALENNKEARLARVALMTVA